MKLLSGPTTRRRQWLGFMLSPTAWTVYFVLVFVLNEAACRLPLLSPAAFFPLATLFTVVFATRGAMSGNGHVIEVLHFVGAEASFIARQFRSHFLLTGMKGAAAGGALAALVFLVFSWWSSRNLATPEGDQAAALFGNFAIGAAGYAGVAIIVIAVAVLTAATTHITVVSYLNDLDATPGER